jgi:hypothetical protein
MGGNEPMKERNDGDDRSVVAGGRGGCTQQASATASGCLLWVAAGLALLGAAAPVLAF